MLKVEMNKKRNSCSSLYNISGGGFFTILRHHIKINARHAWQIFLEYSENTTIHGVKYLGRYTVYEKIWWICTFILCITGLTYFIMTVYSKWHKSNIELVAEDSPTPVHRIPFPAITICPLAKIKRSVFDYSRVYEQFCDGQYDEITSDDFKYFEAVSHICNYNNIRESNISRISNQFSNNFSISSIELIKNVMPTFDDIMVSCNEPPCRQLFTNILTDDGFCYTYNIVTELFGDNMHQEYEIFSDRFHSSNWSPGKGYTKPLSEMENDQSVIYPKFLVHSGRKGAKHFLLSVNRSDVDYFCDNIIEGFKVAIHYPDEIPRMNDHYFSVSMNKEIDFKITPRMIKTDDELEWKSPRYRQCYYPAERKLKFFVVYTEQNCKIECIANLTLEKCDCVPMSLPRTNGTKICNFNDIICYGSVHTESKNIWTSDTSYEKFSETTSSSCDCLPACTSTEYLVDIVEHDVDFHRISNRKWNVELRKDDPEIRYSLWNLYYKEPHFYATKRTESFGMSDMISQFGGLLGLFMGGSLMSLMEIVFFFIVKRFCRRYDD